MCEVTKREERIAELTERNRELSLAYSDCYDDLKAMIDYNSECVYDYYSQCEIENMEDNIEEIKNESDCIWCELHELKSSD